MTCVRNRHVRVFADSVWPSSAKHCQLRTDSQWVTLDQDVCPAHSPTGGPSTAGAQARREQSEARRGCWGVRGVRTQGQSVGGCPVKRLTPVILAVWATEDADTRNKCAYLGVDEERDPFLITVRGGGGCGGRRPGRARHARLWLQVIFKAKSKYSPELLKYRLPLYLASLFVSLLFLLVNLTCALLARTGRWERKAIVSVRVAINDMLFVLCAVSLSVCLYKISKMSLANIYLESKGSSVCQVTAIGATVILLYTSRACYNLVILSFSHIKNAQSFDYDWYNVSDQADLKNQLGDAGYVVFGVVLFVWELLPTTLVVYFFRVRNPPKDLASAGMVPSHGFSPRSYFFDNPRRYDSDDDLAWSIAPQGLQGSLAPDGCDWGPQAHSFLAAAGPWCGSRPGWPQLAAADSGSEHSCGGEAAEGGRDG
ncbi:integral membrane protein GPR137B [Perognathus longimembris pacificus]|uniref:integral membrane protein GPR137B n=1 Tax=Perognathus longimembris pacificus TaxID=214514 RepID=UPI00201A02A5|nr:integral membrane protein GPR137B [Perognathus longimembris pacificus]